MKHRFLCGFLLLLLCSAAWTVTAAPLQSIKNVFIIVMENHAWSSFHGKSSAPYINNTLLPMASRAEAYYSPPGLEPSLPNYLWMEAGTNFGITDDHDPALNAQGTTAHLVTQLEAAGVTWKAYAEDIPGTNCPLMGVNYFSPKHTPFLYFKDVTDNNDLNSLRCIQHVRPFSELAGDLDSNMLAQYVFITPNMCNDGHNSCAPLNDPVAQTDTWLKSNLPMLLNSQPYRNGGAIFITWDEAQDEARNVPIGMIVLSPLAKGNGYSNTRYYNHGSLLRTIQEIFGVAPLLGDAANQSSLSDLFVATGSEECLFHWAETNYSAYFSPPAVSVDRPTFTYRYYSQTNAFLATSIATSTAPSHFYYLGPVTNGTLFDFGLTSAWLQTAGCL